MNKRSLSEIIAEKKRKQAEQLALLEEQKQDREDRIILAPTPTITKALNIIEPLNPTTLPSAKLSLKEKLALIRSQQVDSGNHAEGIGQATLTPSIEAPSTVVESTIVESTKKETFSLSIHLNERQLLAKEMAFSGKSFCLIGAAGTGKTTAQREIAAELLSSGQLRSHSFRIQGEGTRVEAPSIAFIAYTRIASGNLKRAIHKDADLREVLVHNITTFHNLLEYTPETYWDMETSSEKFRFLPKRNSANQLDITHLVIEEASMLGLDHWAVLYKAMRSGVQIIFIGDINQLPPVFGDSILNYALVQLPVVELTHVYRQSEGSLVLENAHNILEGKSLATGPDFQIVTSGQINHTQAKLAISYGSLTFPKWMDQGVYDPDQDIILSPWNKRDLGTTNLNKWIAQSLGTKRKAVVYEILAGRNTLYLAEGDKILFNKRVGLITSIIPNIKYMGKAPKVHSVNLNRFGTYTGGEDEFEDLDSLDYSNLDLDKLLSEETEDKGEAVRAASHIVTILLEGEEVVKLEAAGQFGEATFSLAYALSVHKAQGCEWRKVFIFLHRDHRITLSRELLYTAVTRAREAVVVISKEDVINSTIATQRIKGNTLKEKIEFFNSSMKQLNSTVCCTKD